MWTSLASPSTDPLSPSMGRRRHCSPEEERRPPRQLDPPRRPTSAAPLHQRRSVARLACWRSATHLAGQIHLSPSSDLPSLPLDMGTRSPNLRTNLAGPVLLAVALPEERERELRRRLRSSREREGRIRVRHWAAVDTRRRGPRGLPPDRCCSGAR
jgi:hypothetical protein